MATLNAKQKLFVAAYLVERNSTQAVLASGFTKNWNSARVMGTRLLADVSVRDAIDKGIAAQCARLAITADNVIKEIASVAFDPHARRFEKLKACEMLGKHFKLFTDIHEHQGNMPGVTVNVSLPGNGRESPRDERNSKTQQRPARPKAK